MHVILNLWHILFAVLCGWFNERQQRVIEFQNDQIEALLAKLGKKRVPLTDDRRRVLADVNAAVIRLRALRSLFRSRL